MSDPSADNDLTVFSKALTDFQAITHDLEKKLKSAQTRLEVDFQALDDCANAYAAQANQYARLKGMYQQLSRTDSKDNGGASAAALDECSTTLQRAKLSLDQLKDARSKTGSLYLRLMMGKVNVRLWKKAERMHFKEEYEKFKQRTTYLFTLFPVVQLYYPARWLFTLHQLWVLYYYTSLALRENVLQVNGSTIMNWWIMHHYISMAISTLMLTLQTETNPTPGVGGITEQQLFDKLYWFFWFCVLQGVVMLVQSWYQSNRAYTRKAVGKAKAIDVHMTETLVEKPTDLKVLVPLLFALYVAEIGLGFDLCWFWYYTAPRALPLAGVSALMVLLGIGNGVSTASVLLEKQQMRQFNRRFATRPSVTGPAAAGTPAAAAGVKAPTAPAPVAASAATSVVVGSKAADDKSQ